MPDELKDKTLKCKDCGSEFVFGARDQEFFVKQGYQDPKRCKPCRDAKKQANKSQGQ